MVRADQVRRVEVGASKVVRIRLHPDEAAVVVGELDAPDSAAGEFVNRLSLEARRTDESGEAVILKIDSGVLMSAQAKHAEEYGIF